MDAAMLTIEFEADNFGESDFFILKTISDKYVTSTSDAHSQKKKNQHL